MSYCASSIMPLILAIIFMKLSVCFCASVNGKTQALETAVCTTPACLSAAKSIAQNMNTSKKPCGNFYLFACGTYVHEADIPRGQAWTSPLRVIDNEIREQLKEDLEQDIEDDEPRTFQLLKSFYSTCLDSPIDSEQARNEYNSSIQLLMEELGGWPVVQGESWDESTFDWMAFVEKVHLLGLKHTADSFIQISEVGNKGTKSYKIDRPETSIERSDLRKGLKNEEVKGYYETLIHYATRSGAQKSRAKAEMKKLLDFEIKLAKIPRVAAVTSYTVKQLGNETFPWYGYLNTFLPQDIELDPNQRVFVNLTNFKMLLDLIENTEKRIIANYAFWRLFSQLDIVIAENENFDTSNPELPKTKFRVWQHCITYLMQNMPVAIGALYVRKHVNKSSKSEVQEIVANLMKNFKRFVSETKSMNNLTKKAAHTKLNSMQIHVAYPDELLNDEKLDEYFENLAGDNDNFFENHLALMAFNYHDQLARATPIYNKNNWVYQASAAHIDPRNNYMLNSITINAAVLQKEFFDSNVPNYLNYAGIGKVIGHEITHAFDNHGSKFDEKGRRMDWWDAKSWKEFQNDTKCLTKQYENFKASKRAIALKGATTLHENIADHGGIKVAYAAYEEWVKQNGEEPGLPGLPYTPRQLFWLNIAHTECNRIRKAGWDHMLGDTHSPGPFRILGPFANTPEFARDFNCKVGSRMNPTKKCSFWWNR